MLAKSQHQTMLVSHKNSTQPVPKVDRLLHLYTIINKYILQSPPTCRIST